MLNTNNNSTTDANMLYLQHKLRLEGIATSKKLLDLMLEIQRHRAASLASLGGDLFFENRLYNIQKATTQHLTDLSQNKESLLTEPELQQLNGEWVTIRRQWQKDSVMQNFLLHSHLINLILKINAELFERAGHSKLDEHHRALASYCLCDLPRLIEAAAQARGLATHCAAQKSNTERTVSKIKYLADEIRQLDAKSQAKIVHSSAENYRITQQARASNNNQQSMNIFLGLLKTHFTHMNDPQLLSDEIYTVGSQFIMATHDLLLKTYNLMGKNMDSELYEWIFRPSHYS